MATVVSALLSAPLVQVARVMIIGGHVTQPRNARRRHRVVRLCPNPGVAPPRHRLARRAHPVRGASPRAGGLHGPDRPGLRLLRGQDRAVGEGPDDRPRRPRHRPVELGIVTAAYEPFQNAEAFVAELFPVPKDVKQAAVTRIEKVRSEFTDLHRVAPTRAGFRDTRWAAYNAVVEYLDHFRPVRAGSSAAEDARAVAVLTDAATVVEKKDRALALLTN